MKLIVACHNFALAPKNVSEEEEHSHFRYKVPRRVDVLHVMDKVAPGQVFHGLLSVFLVSVISTILHTHISLSHNRHHISYQMTVSLLKALEQAYSLANGCIC
jgi:hypothetical protein